MEERKLSLSDFQKLLKAQYLLNKLNEENKMLRNLARNQTVVINKLDKELEKAKEKLSNKIKQVDEQSQLIRSMSKGKGERIISVVKNHFLYLDLLRKYKDLKASKSESVLKAFEDDQE